MSLVDRFKLDLPEFTNQIVQHYCHDNEDEGNNSTNIQFSSSLTNVNAVNGKNVDGNIFKKGDGKVRFASAEEVYFFIKKGLIINKFVSLMIQY